MYNPITHSSNTSFSIKLMLFSPQSMEISVYDILGREIKTIHSGNLNNGNYEFKWDGRNEGGSIAPSGIYIISVVGNNRREWKKITLVK